VCAVTDLCASDYDLILPADVLRELAASVAVNVSSCDLGAVCDVGTETSDPEVDENALEDVDSLPVSGVEADSTALVMEQEQYHTLAMCWCQVHAGKGGFVVHKGLLYHLDQVEGQALCQLCVPQGRRDNILQLAHECLMDIWESTKPVKGSGCHFIGLDCVKLCCCMYSRVVNVSCAHVQ